MATFSSICWGLNYGKRTLKSSRPASKESGYPFQLLRLGAIVGLVGILLCLVGAGSTAGVLEAKAVSQPPGVAITDHNRMIRALDVCVGVANINGIAYSC
jgi:hypothetical protein